MSYADRARQLLARCETEMRYAGWSRHTTDNPQHKELYIDVDEFIAGAKHWPDDKPLYTLPPRREWAGLTKDEVAECLWCSRVPTWRAIEAKLKEKNSGHT